MKYLLTLALPLAVISCGSGSIQDPTDWFDNQLQAKDEIVGMGTGSPDDGFINTCYANITTIDINKRTYCEILKASSQSSESNDKSSSSEEEASSSSIGGDSNSSSSTAATPSSSSSRPVSSSSTAATPSSSSRASSSSAAVSSSSSRPASSSSRAVSSSSSRPASSSSRAVSSSSSNRASSSSNRASSSSRNNNSSCANSFVFESGKTTVTFCSGDIKMSVNSTGCSIACPGITESKQCSCSGSDCNNNGVWFSGNGQITIQRSHGEVSCSGFPATECTVTNCW